MNTDNLAVLFSIFFLEKSCPQLLTCLNSINTIDPLLKKNTWELLGKMYHIMANEPPKCIVDYILLGPAWS